MNQEMEVGDIVQLNSGGPQMTITEMNFQNVSTMWFKDDGPHESRFPLACVTKVGDRLDPHRYTFMDSSGDDYYRMRQGIQSTGTAYYR